MKEVLNTPHTNQKIDEIELHGKKIKTPKEIANCFNNFLADAGLKISEKVKKKLKFPRKLT